MPPASLTTCPTGASPHVGESDTEGGRSGFPDLSREGPFDVHQDRPHSGASPQILVLVWKIQDVFIVGSTQFVIYYRNILYHLINNMIID